MAVLGIIKLYWQGVYVPTDPGGTVKLGGVRNKAVVFGQQVQPAAAMMASEVNVTTPVQAGTPVTDSFDTTQGELQVQCDTGQIFTWDDAFLVECLEFTAGDGGKLKLHWSGGEPTELTGI